MLKACATYLSNVLQRGQISLPLEAWQSLSGYNNEYTNMLFQVQIIEDMKVQILYNLDDVPSCSIVDYLENKHGGCFIQSLTPVDGQPNIYMLDTYGQIPIRWLYMLDDFYFKPRGFKSMIVKCENLDVNIEKWLNLLDTLPERTFEKIVHTSYTPSNKRFRVINPNMNVISDHISIDLNDKETWLTCDGKMSPLADKVTQECSKFQSLGNMPYMTLFACEGGISIPYHRYISEWIQFKIYAGSIRNECRGTYSYHTGKDVTVEELTVMMEAFKTCGLKVETY